MMLNGFKKILDFTLSTCLIPVKQLESSRNQVLDLPSYYNYIVESLQIRSTNLLIGDKDLSQKKWWNMLERIHITCSMFMIEWDRSWSRKECKLTYKIPCSLWDKSQINLMDYVWNNMKNPLSKITITLWSSAEIRLLIQLNNSQFWECY